MLCEKARPLGGCGRREAKPSAERCLAAEFGWTSRCRTACQVALLGGLGIARISLIGPASSPGRVTGAGAITMPRTSGDEAAYEDRSFESRVRQWNARQRLPRLPAGSAPPAPPDGFSIVGREERDEAANTGRGAAT